MFTNEAEYLEEDIQLALICKALAHPARLQMMRIVSRKQNCSVKDVVKKMPLAQSTISQHIRALKNAGLLKTSSNGVNNILSVKAKQLKYAEKSIKYLLAAMEY